MNWRQLFTVLWLRWRLTRNQWSRRGGTLSAVLTILALIIALVIALGGGVGGAFAGAIGLAKASPQIMLLVWDGVIGAFLFLWMIGVLTEIQRSETIDLGKLLHLPVSIKWIFVVNYLASHLTLSLVVFLPGTLGLCAGLVWSRGASMVLLVPLVLSFVFMVTAWTYCIRGWLVALMVNPRRRRSIIMGVTLATILLGQLPNFYFNVMRRDDWNEHKNPGSVQSGKQPSAQKSSKETLSMPPAFLMAHTYVPPLWVANGARALSEGRVWPAVWGALAAMVIGGAGLARAYRSTIRFYQGQEKPVASKRALPTKSVDAKGSLLLERRLPALPEEVAAMTLAFLRSLSRAPEVKMSLATSLVVMVVMAAMFFSRVSQSPGELVKSFVATGAVSFTFFSLLQLMFNQFGFDRDGFRALVLLAMERRRTLLAKNLSLAPIAFGIGIVILAILKVGLQLPWLVFLAAYLQLTATFLILSIVGNFVSIVAPYHIAAGSLKPTKTSGKTTLLIFASHLLFPVAMLPIFIPPTLGLLFGSSGWLPGAAVNALFSLALVALVAFLYWLSLRSLGDLLQRRELDILQVVSHEVE